MGSVQGGIFPPSIKKGKNDKKKRKPSKTGLFGVVFAMCGKEERPEAAILGAFGEFQKNAKTEKRGPFFDPLYKKGDQAEKCPQVDSLKNLRP